MAAAEPRRELVGKRFWLVPAETPAPLALDSGGCARLAEAAAWRWRTGVIRAVSHKEPTCVELSVCIEYDGLPWERREWLKVHDEGTPVFVVEHSLVWAPRTAPLPPQGAVPLNSIPQATLDWPALTFAPLVDRIGLGSLVPVEFFGDRARDFVTSKATLRPFLQGEVDRPPTSFALRLEVTKEVQAWLKEQKAQEIFMQGTHSPYLLNGFRVKVYRQDSATQWFTAIITEHNLFSRTMIVMTDQVLEPQNVDPAKVQMAFVDDVVPSLLKGESGGITSRRRSCAGQGASLVTTTTPGIHGHFTRGQASGPAASPGTAGVKVLQARGLVRNGRRKGSDSSTPDDEQRKDGDKDKQRSKPKAEVGRKRPAVDRDGAAKKRTQASNTSDDSDGSDNEKIISKISADTDPFDASTRGPERQSVNVCSLNGRPVSLATTRCPPERRIALGGSEESSCSRPVAEVRPGGPAPIGTVTDSKSYRERDRIAVMETNEGRPFIWDFAPKLNSTAVSIGMPECWGQDYLLAPHSRSSLQLQRWPSPLHPRHEVETLVKTGFQPVAAHHMLNETGRSLEKKDVFLPFSRDRDIDVKPLHFYPHPLPSGTHIPMHAQLGLSPTHLLAAQQSLAFSHAGLYPPATLLAPGHQPMGGPPPQNPALPPALDYRMSQAGIMPQSRAVHASNLTALALAHQHSPQPQLPQPGSLLAQASHPMYSASSLGLYQHVLWPQQAGMRLPMHPGLAWAHPDAQIPDGKRNTPSPWRLLGMEQPTVTTGDPSKMMRPPTASPRSGVHDLLSTEPDRKSHGVLTPPKVEHNELNAGAGLWLPHDGDLARSCERHIKHEVDSPPTTVTSAGGFQLTSTVHPTHRSTYYTALSQSLDNEPSNRIPDERSHALTANSPLPLTKGQGTAVSKSLSKPPPLIRHTPDGSNVVRDKPTATAAGSSRKPPGPTMDSSSPLPPLLRPTVQPSSRERCESGSEPRPPTPLKVASPQQLLAAMMQPLELQPTLPLANGLQQPPGEPPPPQLCSAQSPQHREDGRPSGRVTSAQASVIVRPKSAVVPQPVPTGNVTLSHNPCHFAPSSNSEPISLVKPSTGGSQALDSTVTTTEQNSRTSPTFPAPTPPPAINRSSPVCLSGAQYQSKKQKALQSATQGQSSTVGAAAFNQTILMVPTALSNGNDSDSASVKSDVSSASSSRSPADVCLSGLPPNGPGGLHTKLKKAWLTRHSEEDRSNYNRTVTAVTEAPLETTINTVTTSVVGPGTVPSPPQLKVENSKREVERSADIRRGKRLREEIKQADGGEGKRQKRVLKKDMEDQAKRKRSKDEGKASVSGKTCEPSAVTKETTETRRGKNKEKSKRSKKENAGSEMKGGERRGRADAREERRTKRAAKRALELGSESEEGSDECIEGRGSEARVKRQPKPTFKKKQIDLQRRKGNVQAVCTTTPQADEHRDSEFPSGAVGQEKGSSDCIPSGGCFHEKKKNTPEEQEKGNNEQDDREGKENEICIRKETEDKVNCRLDDEELPESVLRDWRKVRRLKQSCQAFLQDGACASIAPSLQKCRECRLVRYRRAQDPHSAVFCRFYHFRRLSFNKNGALRIDGFSASGDCQEEDLRHWIPAEVSTQGLPGSGSTCSGQSPVEEMRRLALALYLLTYTAAPFCRLVRDERAAMARIDPEAKVAWKRAVRGVREMCDACEATLFNIHWVCPKCGFVVCPCCYAAHRDRREHDADSKKETSQWMKCVKGQVHDYKNLIPTQIIPGTALNDLSEAMHTLRARLCVGLNCPCTNEGLAQAEKLPPNINGMSQVLHTLLTTTLKNGMNLGEGPVGSSDDREMNVASMGAHDDLNTARSEVVLEGRALSPSALHWLVNLATEKAKEEKKDGSSMKPEQKPVVVLESMLATAVRKSSCLEPRSPVVLLEAFNALPTGDGPGIATGAEAAGVPEGSTASAGSTLRALLTSTAGKLRVCADESNMAFAPVLPIAGLLDRGARVSPSLEDIILSIVENRIPLARTQAPESQADIQFTPCSSTIDGPHSNLDSSKFTRVSSRTTRSLEEARNDIWEWTHDREAGGRRLVPLSDMDQAQCKTEHPHGGRTADEAKSLPRVEVKVETEESRNELLELRSYTQDPQRKPAYQWLHKGRVLHMYETPIDPGGWETFRQCWIRNQPVLVSSSRDPAATRSLGVWGPETLCLDLGRQDVEVENCRTSASIPVSLKEFWDGFVDFEKRPKDSDGKFQLLRLKDLPSGDDLHELMPARFDSLLTALPLPEYTNPDGQMNLASHLPSFFVRPDLGPIMHCAYGLVTDKDMVAGSWNLQVHPADSANILVHSESMPEDGIAAQVVVQVLDEAGVDKETQTLLRQSSRHPAAVWHVFSPEDADKIQSFLAQLPIEDGGPAESDILRSHSWFLDRNLRQRLADEQGVRAVPVVQSLGDVVLIPAGTPFQVQNLRSCVFVSQEFISHEHANRCLEMVRFMQCSPDGSCEDKLQIYNIIYHAVKDAVGVLKSVGSQNRHCHTDGMKLSP
uniref:probable JmjC domain-containing histone demethylation protein 2C isoform X2 n=1 Tax=Myxine glutinosa TaxID=7769 RepID=UPI00359026F9